MPRWLDRIKHRRPKSPKAKSAAADEAKTIRISPREVPPAARLPRAREDHAAPEQPVDSDASTMHAETPVEDTLGKTVAVPRGALRAEGDSRDAAQSPAKAGDEAIAPDSKSPGDSPTVVLKIAYEAKRFPADDAPPPAAPRETPAISPLAAEGPENSRTRELALVQARERLNKVQEKINQIAEEFAEGQVNRAQFQELFDHYQRERRTILAWIETASEVPNWRELAAEGRSMVIRRQHKARVLGYAICEQQSGLPLRSIGMFEEDPELVVPMLTAYRSATEEIFGAGMRSTEIEGGRWLCFVAGEFTMLMVLFSNEPARKDLEGLDELLRTFERMNRYILRRHPIKPDELFLPYRFYIDNPK